MPDSPNRLAAASATAPQKPAIIPVEYNLKQDFMGILNKIKTGSLDDILGLLLEPENEWFFKEYESELSERDEFSEKKLTAILKELIDANFLNYDEMRKTYECLQPFDAKEEYAAYRAFMLGRVAKVTRKTQETTIQLALALDGGGQLKGCSGIAFFDHMLKQITRHGQMDIQMTVQGDLTIDAHHTVEDCGIVLGQAVESALGDKQGIRRFGYAYAPLDESLSRVVVDLSGRPSLVYKVAASRTEVGGVDVDLFREFFQAFVNHARISVHIDLLRGMNAHHQIESVFKAFGLAFASAKTIVGSDIPSTKGML